jgi:putative hydrolase of the HAD superfamily
MRMVNRTIRNIIFDYGNVLVRHDLGLGLELLSKRSTLSAKEIGEALKQSGIIDLFDAGTLHPNAFNEQLAILIGWSGSVADLRSVWEQMNTPDPKMIMLMHQLRSDGFRVYILSNINPFHAEQAIRSFEFVTETDGTVFSYQCGFIKPQTEIYRYLIDTFGIDPKESLFIDDVVENVRAAELLGITSIVHASYESTRDSLCEILKLDLKNSA